MQKKPFLILVNHLDSGVLNWRLKFVVELQMSVDYDDRKNLKLILEVMFHLIGGYIDDCSSMSYTFSL